MKIIIVSYQPFLLKNEIYVVNENETVTIKVPGKIAAIAETVTDLAHKYEIALVRIDAGNCFKQEIKECIKNFELKNYKENKIIVGDF